MSLAVQDGVLIAKDGSLGTGSECCCVQDPPCEGTCCIDGVCSQSTKADCIAAGGKFYKCEESCSAGYCTSPPSCESLGCTEAQWDTAVVTINIDTFTDVLSDTPEVTASCTARYKEIWQSKVEELNGTYTLAYDTLNQFGQPAYIYESGTPGTTGYLRVIVLLPNSYTTNSVSCAKLAGVGIELVNLSELGPELYSENVFPFVCTGPGQLNPLTGSKVASTTALTVQPNDFYIDMCDGQSLTDSLELFGNYDLRPSCRTFQCLRFSYTGTAAVTLTNA